MLIGIQYSDLSKRTRALLVVASLAMLAGLGVYLFKPQAPVLVLQVWLLAIVILGMYWLSFLADFRGRLSRSQLWLASLFGVLPWIVVIAVVLTFPQVLLGSAGLPTH